MLSQEDQVHDGDGHAMADVQRIDPAQPLTEEQERLLSAAGTK